MISAPPAPNRRRLNQKLLADRMTEDQLLEHVLDAAKKLGWRTAHFRPAKTDKGWRTPVSGDGKGFPDLVLLRRGRMLVVEMKSETAPAPKAEQADWLSAFEAVVSVQVCVWRPRHWLTGEIERALL